MTLTTSQKIVVGIGNFFAGLGVIFAGERLVRSDPPGMLVGAGLVLLGTIFALVAMFRSRPKPTNLVVITNIIYTCLGSLIAIAGAVERNIMIVSGGIAVQIIGLIGMNVAVFKPGDLKVFNVVNIICAIVGVVLVLVAQFDDSLKDKETTNLLGILIVAMAATATNITLYHKC